MKQQRKTTRIILMAALAALCLIVLSGCGKYISSHSAIGFVHSNSAKAGDMSFSSFEGSEAFNLQVDSEAGGQIQYSAKLKEGAATVYYDTDGTKKELFSVKAGDDVNASGGTLAKGPLYIIVETTQRCQDGEFHFSIH